MSFPEAGFNRFANAISTGIPNGMDVQNWQDRSEEPLVVNLELNLAILNLFAASTQ